MVFRSEILDSDVLGGFEMLVNQGFCRVWGDCLPFEGVKVFTIFNSLSQHNSLRPLYQVMSSTGHIANCMSWLNSISYYLAQ